ncbi:MAG: hypothetical protein D6754_07560 [Alphaproteobacteria bacterium]|nr:MAG: hypothetical protein D6754_07560 [Alphaproteobacteria bacterium]
MADAKEVRLNFSIDPLQELKRDVRKVLINDFKVKLPPITVRQSVFPTKSRWDARKIEAAARAFVRYELAIIATVAEQLHDEVGRAANDRDRAKAIKTLNKRLEASYKKNAKKIRDKIEEGLEEIESEKNPDEEKALRLAEKSLDTMAAIGVQQAILDLNAEFLKHVSDMIRKIDNLKARGDVDDDGDGVGRGERRKNSGKDPVAAQRAKLVATAVKALKSASDDFDSAIKKARDEITDMIDTMKLGAKKKDLGEEAKKSLTNVAGLLTQQLDRLTKSYRDTKPARDMAIRAAASEKAYSAKEIIRNLPQKGGLLWKAAEKLDKTIKEHRKKLGVLHKAAK